MAPRGRHRKVGLTRMDAAIDNLLKYGFTKDLIHDTVKSLLKVYGGDSGWVFIEDDSYKVVVDEILEFQEKRLPEKDEAQEADAVPTTGLQTVLETETRDPQTAAEIETDDPHTAAETERDLPLAEEGASGRKKVGKIQSLQPAGDLPHPKRKPCYGWVSCDDEDGIVFLRTNKSLRRIPIKSSSASNGGRRRKTRWDVKPEDLYV